MRMLLVLNMFCEAPKLVTDLGTAFFSTKTIANSRNIYVTVYQFGLRFGSFPRILATTGVKNTVGGNRTGDNALWAAYAMATAPTFSPVPLTVSPNLPRKLATSTPAKRKFCLQVLPDTFEFLLSHGVSNYGHSDEMITQRVFQAPRRHS